MPNSLLGIFRHKCLELGFGILMLQVSVPCSLKHARKFGPAVRRAHVDDPHGREPDPRRLDPEEARRVPPFYTPPEFLFRLQKEGLVERIGGYFDLHPVAAASAV